MIIHLVGHGESRRVWLNEEELLPGASQQVINHSPDGFNCGYHGSGPAQLALAICIKIDDPNNYQEFKRKHIAGLPIDENFDIIINWP